MKKLSFYNRIILGFALIFIIMLCKTFFVIIQLRNINKTMDTLYEHPYKVSNAVKEFNTEILKSYINLRDIRYFDTPQQLDSLKNKVSESEKMIDNQLIIITQRYLGNKIDVDSITGDLSEWKRLTEQTFQIKKTTSVDNLVLFLTKDVRQQVYKIMKHSAAINAFASKRAETFMKNIIAAENKTLNTLYILLIVISIIAFTLSHFLSKSISKPIKEFARKAVSIFSIQTKNKNYSTENEEDLLTFTLKELEYSYQNIEQQNEEIKSSNEQLFEINKNLEEKTKNLKETNQSLEEMVYITSHDLQAPLVSMEGYATELLKDYADKFDEEGYYCLTRLQSNARRMHHLVLSLLDISRLNTKKNQYEKFKLKLIIEKVMMDLT